jgi:hypothetical protein
MFTLLCCLVSCEQVVCVYDMDAIRSGCTAAIEAFPPHTTHCFAIKSAPLAAVLNEVKTAHVIAYLHLYYRMLWLAAMLRAVIEVLCMRCCKVAIVL